MKDRIHNVAKIVSKIADETCHCSRELLQSGFNEKCRNNCQECWEIAIQEYLNVKEKS